MPYIHEETVAGDTVIIRNHFSSRYHMKGLERSDNKNETTPAQMAANNRKDSLELTIRLNENFHPGDYWATFTYSPDERPQTADEAKKDRSKLLRKLRNLYRKNDTELKFIAVTEFGKKGALHHHIVINGDVDFRKVGECWTYGRAKVELLDKNRQYSKIASYIIKNREKWKEHGGSGKMWTCSRNLRRPETRKTIVNANKYLKKPRERKGYYVTEFIDGINEDGWPYQSYILVKTRGERAP